MKRTALLLWAVGAILLPASASALPVFPGAEGFGTETEAGRGGAMIIVDSLATQGPGTFAECVNTPGPRACVFAVSGTIDVGAELEIREPFLTLAGQSAPSPGVTIRGSVVIRTHDVLVQHIRFRVGDLREADAIAANSDPGGEGTYNIVLDHITASWANDENISAYPGEPEFAGEPGYTVSDYTLSNSLSSEGLAFAPGHSMGFLAARPGLLNFSVHKNLFVHNGGRNPKLGNGRFVVANNVIYNWAYAATAVGSDAGVFDGAYIANVWHFGPDVENVKRPPIEIETGNAETNLLYVAANQLDGEVPADPWTLVSVVNAVVEPQDDAPAWLPDLTMLETDELTAELAECAGARPLDRDPVDVRVIESLLAGTGSLIDCVDAGAPACSTESPRTPPGGWPTLAENTVDLDIPPDPAGDDDGDGYTNAEEWLHALAADVECGADGGGDATGGTSGSGMETGEGSESGDTATGSSTGSATTGGGGTGGAGTSPAPGATVTDAPSDAAGDSAGCGCQSAPFSLAALWLTPLVLVARRRRRR